MEQSSPPLRRFQRKKTSSDRRPSLYFFRAPSLSFSLSLALRFPTSLPLVSPLSRLSSPYLPILVDPPGLRPFTSSPSDFYTSGRRLRAVFCPSRAAINFLSSPDFCIYIRIYVCVYKQASLTGGKLRTRPAGRY